MRRREAELQAAGARLLFVGPGTPEQAAHFAAQAAGPHPVLSDAGGGSYRAAALRRAPWLLLHWRLWRNLWRALRSGFRQSRVQGNPWWQGGAVVLARPGRLVHAQQDGVAGDPLDLDALLAAARGVP